MPSHSAASGAAGSTTVNEAPRASSDGADVELMSDSTMIPAEWLAEAGRTTPDGGPATYRSSIHALMALRLRYRRDVLHETNAELETARARYQASWDRYRQHGFDMQALIRLADDGDGESAAAAWNGIDQPAVDDAYRTVIGEREPVKVGGVNLMTCVWNEYGLEPSSVAAEHRDRESNDTDSEEAWNRTSDGCCNGCGTPTISVNQRKRLHALMKSNPSSFDLTPTRRQFSGNVAPLWDSVTIAAKGVADHIVPRCQGGRTDPSNLTNSCSGCNYSRLHATMDSMGVQAYDRPDTELTSQNNLT